MPPRFCIITPTFGRESLKRCVVSLEQQMYRNFVQVVIGDGPLPEWVREFCEEDYGCFAQYLETPAKEAKGAFGAAPRNFALDNLPPCDFVVFLDDDNELLETALYQIMKAVVDNDSPPLLYQEILFTNKYMEEYCVFPKTHTLVAEREWDLLNGIYRRDVIGSTRFAPEYRGDFLFAKEIWERLAVPWIKVKGIGGIHHLSWDTYDG